MGYEYELYLPLYNIVKWLEIGVPQDAKFSWIPVSKEKPLVIYGTSIAQGACASRPGMAWANIIERELEHPVVNLGFSGSAKLNPELFDMLAEIEAKLYIIDCMPNMGGKAVNDICQLTIDGVKKLRRSSQAPILLVEHSGYVNEWSSELSESAYRETNVELRKAYGALLQAGLKGLHYLTKEEIGLTMDAMVEGVHPSDLGMHQYADAYIRKIRTILQESTAPFVGVKQQRDPYNWQERHEQVLERHCQQAPEVLMIGNSIIHYWNGLLS